MPDLNTLSDADRRLTRIGLGLLAEKEKSAAKHAEVVGETKEVRKFEGLATYITDTLIKEFETQQQMLGNFSPAEAQAGIANNIFEFFQDRGAGVSQELCDKLATHLLAFVQFLDMLAYTQGRQDARRNAAERIILALPSFKDGIPAEPVETVGV